MHSNEQSQIRRGPAALLALLLGVLLGNAGPVLAAAEFGPAGVSQPRSGKPALLVRSAKRDSDEESDPSDLPPLWLGAAPDIVTDPAAIRPTGGSAVASARVAVSRRASPFRARAPPAA